MTYYVKRIGTTRAVEILAVEKGDEEYRLKVILQGRTSYIYLIDNPSYLEFSNNNKLCTWNDVKRGMNVKDS